MPLTWLSVRKALLPRSLVPIQRAYAVSEEVPVKNGVPVVGEMYTESARKAGSSYCVIAGNGAEMLAK